MHRNQVLTVIKQRDLGYRWDALAERYGVTVSELRKAVRDHQATPQPARKRSAVREEQRRRRAALVLERDAFVRRMLRNGYSIAEMERIVRMTQRTMSELLEP